MALCLIFTVVTVVDGIEEDEESIHRVHSVDVEGFQAVTRDFDLMAGVDPSENGHRKRTQLVSEHVEFLSRTVAVALFFSLCVEECNG